ncbi:MAG: Na+/H+ antiporter NhaA, partial [Acidimicrobiales bacterium]
MGTFDAGPGEEIIEAETDREIRLDAIGGVLLLSAAVAALVWANLDHAGYLAAFRIGTSFEASSLRPPPSLLAWINDGAMTVFFFAIGLELGREVTDGELSEGRSALAPLLAAAGGMAGAALVYLAVAHNGVELKGYGIPMATDVAFALAALSVLGRRVPRSVKVFVLALAVADDFGSVVVLALGYSEGISWGRLGVAVAAAGALAALRGRRVEASWPFVLAGIICWGALLGSGVEPILAGFLAGFAIVPGLRSHRIEHRLQPVVALLVLPVFALANAGVALSAHEIVASGGGAVFAGVAAARVAGKIGGILLGAFVASRFLGARLPTGAGWRHLGGAAAMCGIGFTVPLLVTARAFGAYPLLASAARVG